MIRFSIDKLALLVVVQFFVLSAHSQQELYDDSVFYYDEYGWSVGASIGLISFDKLHFDMVGSIEVGDDTSSDSLEVLRASGYSDLTQSVPVPTITIAGEYRPYGGLSFGFEGTYFQQDHKGGMEFCVLDDINQNGNVFLCDGSNILFDGKSKSVVLLIGGNYFFGNSTPVTPYLTADLGIGTTLLELNQADDNDIIIVDDQAHHSVIQGGAGFDVDLGPVTLGASYDYILLGDYNLYQNEQILSTDPSGTETSLDLTNEFTMRSLGGHRAQLKLTIKPGVLRGAR